MTRARAASAPSGVTRQHVAVAAFGVALGFALSHIGFSDWAQVHRMFTFADRRLFWTFLAAVALAGAGFALVARRDALPRNPVHRGTAAGAAMFGAGWALTGACPAVALVQLGEGRLPALLTLAGVLLGTWAYGPVHARWFRWHRGNTCG